LSLTNENFSVALGSGGARGLAHIGILKTLKQNGINIEALSGTSMGAVIGAFFAADKLEEAEEYYRSLKVSDVIFNFDPVFPSSGLINGKKVMQLLRDVIGDIYVFDTKIPFYPVATELDTGEWVVLQDCKLWEAIRASISIPGLFKPFKIKGKYYVDGGITNPVPVNVLKERHEKTKTIAVNLNLKPTDYKRAWIKETDNETSFLLNKFPRLKKIAKKIGINGIRNKKEKDPNILHVLNRTFHIVQYELAWRSLEFDKPNFLLTPNLSDVVFIEFHKAAKSIAEGERVAREFVESLKN